VLTVALGKQRGGEKFLEHLKLLLEEHGSLGGLSTNIEALLSINAEKAVQVWAVLELAKRLMQPVQRRFQIRCVQDAVDLVRPEMRFLSHEEMHILLLDTKNYLVAHLKHYRGTVNSSVLRGAEILRLAITRNTPNIIICHNHPSGDAEPSPEDREVTLHLAEACKLLDIELHDHIIIGNPSYVSLKERLKW
jgi:DNA repair protein RadC